MKLVCYTDNFLPTSSQYAHGSDNAHGSENALAVIENVSLHCCHHMCVYVGVDYSQDYALTSVHMRVQLGGHLGRAMTKDLFES